ncbi:MAG TPA: hypothetical protein VET27_10755 [Mycobacterium sp.]|nr:hypothetical protein [Mycobacterium sp.]
MVNPNIAEIVGGATEQLRYVQTILRVADGTDQLDELAKSVVNTLAESVFAGFGRHYVPDPEDVLLGRRVVADQFEDALQRQLFTAVSDYTTDVMLDGRRGATEL